MEEARNFKNLIDFLINYYSEIIKKLSEEKDNKVNSNHQSEDYIEKIMEKY